MIELNKIYNQDCLEVMKDIPDKIIDMILCDLPYGTTACKWDTIIPFEPLWEQYRRIIKDNGAIVLTASQPFTSALVMSNIKMFKYEWIWDKKLGTGFGNANKMPLKNHENVLVFYKHLPKYNPQFSVGTPYKKGKSAVSEQSVYGKNGLKKDKDFSVNDGKRFPKTIINDITNANHRDRFHPTQKPVALFEYLIKTYTNEGDLVLDNCAGSGTTAVACVNTNRNFIGIELSEEYCKIATERLSKLNDGNDGIPPNNKIGDFTQSKLQGWS